MTEWNGGVDYWSGALDWNTGVPRPQISCVLGMHKMSSSPRAVLNVCMSQRSLVKFNT